MSAGWIIVRLIEAPDRPLQVAVDKVLAIGGDPEGGCRLVLTNGQHYDVTDNLDVVVAKLTQAG